MKTKLVLLFILISRVPILAQEKNSSISITTGIASAVGTFGEIDGQQASSGSNLDIVFQSKFKHTKTLGYIFMFRSQTVDVDKAGIQELFSPGTVVSTTHWSSTSYMVGFKWSLACSKIFFVEPRWLLGMMSADSPTIAITNSTIQATLHTAHSNAFSSLFGLNFRLDFAQRLSLLLNTDYQISFAGFDSVFSSAYSGQSTVVTTNPKITTLNVGAGLGFRF